MPKWLDVLEKKTPKWRKKRIEKVSWPVVNVGPTMDVHGIVAAIQRDRPVQDFTLFNIPIGECQQNKLKTATTRRIWIFDDFQGYRR